MRRPKAPLGSVPAPRVASSAANVKAAESFLRNDPDEDLVIHSGARLLWISELAPAKRGYG
jgi:hypothetical protein